MNWIPAADIWTEHQYTGINFQYVFKWSRVRYLVEGKWQVSVAAFIFEEIVYTEMQHFKEILNLVQLT